MFLRQLWECQYFQSYRNFLINLVDRDRSLAFVCPVNILKIYNISN